MWGQVRVQKEAQEGNDLHGGHGCVCEGDTARVRVRSVNHGLVEIELLCFMWLSLFLILYTYPPMKMEQTGCSETLAFKIQMLGYYPKENIQHSEYGESLKSGIM